MEQELILMLIQLVIIVILLVIVIFMLKQNISIRHEKRIGKYSIEPVKSKESSVFDILYMRYFDFVKKMRKKFLKIKFFQKKSLKYEKYIELDKDNLAIDYIIHKIVISISFVLLTIFSQVIQTRLVTPMELLINLIIGYYILDIYLFYMQKRRIKKIENEMLRAIIIMNNAFKAGKSTMQAVYIASEELPEPISIEFKKIYQDLKYGLNVDVVFERFSKRVNIEESRYISSSLVILNKTGGNIVKVFNSIEKTLFDKKKLKEELKNLTVSSNLVVKVLMFIPFVFVAIIYLLNPNYFDPLFSSTLGFFVIGVIIIMIAIYIWVLQKILKVKV